MVVQIKQLTKEMLPDLLIIENESFTKPWKETDFIYELDSNPFAYYLVMQIKETKEIIGYIGFYIKFEYAEISKIAILRKYRGLKLSKLLMADMEKRVMMANCESISLEVRISNEKAINLYKSFNYKIITTRKHYYENGEDAYLMIKEIK